MKALTLTQPWAQLVAIEAKKIETRSWSTSYRGPLAIHAAKRFPKEAQDICLESKFAIHLYDYITVTEVIGDHLRHPYLKFDKQIKDSFPLGAVIATCELVHVREIDIAIAFSGCKSYARGGHEWFLTPQERAFGDFSEGRYMWLLENVKLLPEPIPAKGLQRLWEWKGGA